MPAAHTAFKMPISLEVDEGWDTELVQGTRPRAYKAIDARLINNGLLAHSRGNSYMYLGASNSWAVLASPEAQKQLCDITGSDNVSVSYLGATIPYLPYLQKHSRRTSALPTSVCIGTRRFNITINEDTIILTDCANVASVNANFDGRIGSFCVMPCTFNEIPRTWTASSPGRLYKYLSPLFTDVVEFYTLMWVVGNALVDPISFSKFVFLYGPGGTGKSKVLGAIKDVMQGCCGSITPGQLVDNKADMNIETAKTLVSNRVVTAGDVNLTTSKLSLHIVKQMTGHDSVVIPPISVATSCSVICSSNGLPNPLEQPEWTSSAISRRMVVVLMNVKASLLPPRERPDTVEDNLDFLMNCVYMRLTEPSMPISIRCLLYSVLGSYYEQIADEIIIDPSASVQDLFDVNIWLDMELNLPLHTIGELASLVSSSCTIMYGGVNFIKDIRRADSKQTE